VTTVRLPVLAVVGALVAASLVGASATAEPAAAPRAQAATPGTPLDARAPDVAIDLERSRRQMESQARRLSTIDADLTTVNSALESLNQSILANQVQLSAVKARIASQAAALYQRGDGASTSLLDVGSVRDLGSAQQYASAAMSIDTKQLDSLNAIEQSLEDQRSARTKDHDDLTNNRAEVSSSIADLTQRTQSDQQKLDDWGAIPVMGDSILTPPQLAAWYGTTGQTAKLAPGVTIDDVARLFIVEGRAEQVRGDLAFAQAMVETGGFQVAAGNNYSGIGVCDSCQGGYVFPTPLDGIRAQIQLLRNYADPDSRASNLANPPSPTLYGASAQKAAATYDSFFLKGKAPLWNQMGGGNWATDPTYAHKVIDLFNTMVAYANQHP
jgi:hypothetical protein